MSVRFEGESFTFTQPDGTTIQLKGWGDQHYAVFEDLNGYTVVRDPITGTYQFAELNADESELVPCGLCMGPKAKPKTAGLKKHVRITREAARAEVASARGAIGSKRRCDMRREARHEQMSAARTSSIALAPPNFETTGEYVGLCLLIDFSDQPSQLSRAQVNAFCNQQGYNEFENNGSVYDYFFDVSNQKLRYTNVVVDYYRAIHPRSYYTDEALPQPQRARELIKEALEHLKASGFNFTDLSADSGGYAYALNIFYAGTRINNWGKGLWPHSFHMGVPFTLGPGRKAFDYQITDMGPELTLQTFCHENGHMICDFPDLYDYGSQSQGAGNYCLMCYGGPDKKNPCHVGGYLKYKAGWADSVTSIASGMIDATISAENDEFFIHAKNSQEYFLIENRRSTERDISLPSSGLAIWHVDETGSNDYEQMTSAQHYECSLEQADGNFDLEMNKNIGDASDLFSSTTKDAFGDTTSPNSRWWDGSSSMLEIKDISVVSASMTFSTKDTGAKADVFDYSLTPELDIPDNDATGVRVDFDVEKEGIAASVEVTVQIEHPYRGDLAVSLVAPSGNIVGLHHQQGGNQQDLYRTFDVVNTPSLGDLAGEAIHGQWTLRVQDLAPKDEGVFKECGLRIQTLQSSVIELAESPGTRIPDAVPAGIERTLSTDASGTVREVEVSVDITHTYIRDLVIELVSPKGTVIELHRRAGGDADNVIETYKVASVFELDTLRGENVAGSWRLMLKDLEAKDEGKLNHWGLKIITED